MELDGSDETALVNDNLCVNLEAAISDLDEKRVRELLDLLKQRDDANGSCTLEGEVGYTMLRNAIQKNRNIAKLLIEHGVDVNRPSNQACNSPLHIAIKNVDFVLVEMLLNRGARTRAKNSQGKTPLYLAVECNCEKIIETLLEKDNEPNLNTKNKLFPIDAAAKNGNERIFNLLVSKGAKSNTKYCDGTVMLDVAVEKGYSLSVSQILKYTNSEINKNSKNNKLITVAVLGNEPGHQAIAKTLFNAKFPLDPESIHNVEFVHKVVETGHTDILDDLLKLGADPNTVSLSGNALLITACKSQRAEIVKLLIKNNADVRVKDIYGRSVLYYAIDNLHSSNHKWRFYNSVSDDSDCEDEKFADDKVKCFSDDWFEITKMLIDKGIDVNEKDETHLTPLYYVAKNNYTHRYYHYIKELTILLLKSGADIKCRDKNGNTPLQYAILQGCLEMVKLLLQQDSASDDTKTFNNKRQTLLHSAASIKSRSIIKLLLKRKYFENVDFQDIDGKTPLHLAVQNLRLKTVKLLLKHNANANVVDKKMWTPLLCAIHIPYQLAMVETLLEHKADANCINKDGLTPLFIAASHTCDEYIQMLLKYGADLNLKIGDSGKTALHCLAECENKCVDKIIKYGADINILSNDEKTALDYLMESMVSYCKKNNVELNPLRSFIHVEYYTNKYRDNAQNLIEHILKLKTINSYVCEKNLLSVYKYELDYGWINDREMTYKAAKKSKIDEFQKKCEQEIELMKQHTINNTKINIYQILTKCTHRLAKYILNENVNQQLREFNHAEKFPIYCDLIKLRIEKCSERKKILHQDTDYSFQRVFPSLPYDCIDKILGYLDNKDLQVLITVCQLSTDSHVSVSDTNNSNVSNPNNTSKRQKIITMLGYYTKFSNPINDGTYFMLRDAVQRKNSELAKSLLNNGAQVNSPHSRSCNTVLHFATMNRNEELVQMLLDAGAYVNIPNTHGKTPLHLAVEGGSERIVELLVNKGANVNTVAKDNSRPIEKAIAAWRSNIFKLLVCHGANVNITLSNGETLLHRAVNSNNPSTVKCILEKSSINKNMNKHCLTTAVLNGNEKIEQLLIKHGFEVEPQCVKNSKFFHAIVARGYTKCVNDLLKMGADVNALRQETTKYSLLHTACINRKLQITKLLIQHDIDLNLKDSKEKTAIFYAVKNGDFNIVKLLVANRARVGNDPDLLNIAAHNQCIGIVQILLEHGVNINASDRFGNTALHSALSERLLQLDSNVTCILSSKDVKTSLVRVLLKKGADVNIRMKDGRTPLHLAVRTNKEEIVNTLLEHNSQVNVSDVKGITPLHLAVQAKNLIIVDSLLSKKADIKATDIKSMTALHFASEVGYLDIIKSLLRYQPDVNAVDQFCLTPLHCAAKYGHLKAVKILLEHHANEDAVDISGSTSLHLAVEARHHKIVEHLLKFDPDMNSPDDNGETYLHIAVKNKDIDTTRLLLNYSIDVDSVNKDGLTPLLIAALYNYSILIKLLIENGADIHFTDPLGRSALLIAAENNNLEIASSLLKKHADVNCKDKNGLTPLLIAVCSNHENLTGLFLEHNADVNCPDQNDKLAIHIAMENRNESIVLKLLTHGADVNSVDDQGSTALLTAISQASSQQFIEKLLMLGADVNHRNNEGETALHIAAKMKRSNIIAMLLRYGTDINIKCHRNKTALFHTYEYTYSDNRPSSSDDEGCGYSDCECWDGGYCDRWNRRSWYDEDEDYQYENFSCHVDECSSVVAVFKQHILKLQAAKFDVDDSNIHALRFFKKMESNRDNGENYDIDSDEYNESDSDMDSDSDSEADIQSFDSKEIMELESMRNEKIGNSNISFYEFLTSSVHRLARYVKNENIVEIINLNDYDLIFPIYSDIIKSRYHMGIERNKLLTQCEFLGDIFVDLPDTCIDEIISYLNNQELRFLTNAYKDQNFSNKRKIHLVS
ncbi:uncharacterized protein LOC103577382 [Microplitis demolitor]|uniref:uncharacterized protein LOC103577382 n=1 Tax=Microplitis demolitor TaxID=69319 RepID=UPI0004CDC70C|nr:uncharacterized protein LOC103577382 [Microplitis demolitor]